MMLRLILPMFTLLALLVAAPSSGAAPFQVGLQSNNTLMDPTLTLEQRAANFDEMKDAGADIVRISLHWDWVAVNPLCSTATALELENPDHLCYTWTLYDQIALLARERGIEIVASVYGVPVWVHGRPDPAFMGASKSQFNRLVPLWAAFQKAAARRYDRASAYGTIAKWTVHNEPNSSTFWKPRPNPVQYATLFRAAAEKIKQGNPAAKVAAGPTGPFSPAYKPAKFMRAALPVMQRNGSRRYLDAWAHNPYPGGPVGPRARGARLPNIGTSNIREMFKILDSYRVTRKKPVWATEFAWQTNPPDRAVGIPLARQAQYLAESLDIFETTGRVHMAIWYAYRDPVDIRGDWQSGLTNAAGAPKPSLSMFRRPVSRSATVLKRGRVVSLWGASTLRPGTQVLQYSTNRRSWRRVARQRKDRNGSVSAVMRPTRTIWVRTKDAGGVGPALKIKVRRR